MRKKFLYLILICISLFYSCVANADQMLEQFNDEVYEDVGDGNYINNSGQVNISTTLLSKNVYRVMEQNFVEIEVSPKFMEYKWTLIDNKTDSEKVIGDNYWVNINSAILGLKADGNYTINLLVRNRNNLLFTDTATLKVVYNIYN